MTPNCNALAKSIISYLWISYYTFVFSWQCKTMLFTKKQHAVTSSERAHSITWYKQKRRRNRWASKQVARRYHYSRNFQKFCFCFIIIFYSFSILSTCIGYFFGGSASVTHVNQHGVRHCARELTTVHWLLNPLTLLQKTLYMTDQKYEVMCVCSIED